ncbi:MAG: acyl-CoA dehydrogenase family protein, partial [Polymorphobacter sp.]
QQLLSQFALEVAAVRAAAAAACDAAECGDAGFEIAAAKLRTNIAIGIGTAAAHQVHGAIGFTQDYALQPLTRRLWSWRSEFGNDAFWAVRLGTALAKQGAAAFWPQLVDRSDRLNRRMS